MVLPTVRPQANGSGGMTEAELREQIARIVCDVEQGRWSTHAALDAIMALFTGFQREAGNTQPGDATNKCGISCDDCRAAKQYYLEGEDEET